MKPECKSFKIEYYQAVYNFFVELNNDKKYINWNYARWEWAYFHPLFDKKLADLIGVWIYGGKVVGIAVFDLFLGECFCGTLPGYEKILPEIVDYAWECLQNENGLGICARDDDKALISILEGKGFRKSEQCEPIMKITLDKDLAYSLANNIMIRDVNFPNDEYAYRLALWKGFDHGNDLSEFEKSLTEEGAIPIDAYPHRNASLSLSAADESGEHLAHCTCWYDIRTDYAYVEPVCVIPEHRGNGLGRAVVYEALNRCRGLGAKCAYVISDDEFYKKLGFDLEIRYPFYQKKI